MPALKVGVGPSADHTARAEPALPLAFPWETQEHSQQERSVQRICSREHTALCLMHSCTGLPER